MKRLRDILAFLLILFGASAAAAVSEGLQPFLSTYCIDCHNGETQKGDRSFHKLAKLEGEPLRLAYEDILDQLNLGEMPPEKKDVAQPKLDEVRAIVAALTKTLARLEPAEAPVALRRMNRREYRNTIRDLLGLEELSFDPTRYFPTDEPDHGFTNIGSALDLSDAHLENYLNAAKEYLDVAFHFTEEPPPATLRKMSTTDWGYPQREPKTPWMFRHANPKGFLDIGAGAKDLSSRISLITHPAGWTNRGGIKEAGYYRIRVKASAVHRTTHGYDPELIPGDLTVPMQLGLHVAREREGLEAPGANHRQRIGLWDLPDGEEPETFDAVIWLGKGAVPFLNWDNGPGPSDYWMRDVLKKHHPRVEFRGKEGSHAWHIQPRNPLPDTVVSDVWHGPVIRVREFSFYGPLPRSFASKTQQEYFGKARLPWEIDHPTALTRFASKAFRRPATEKEIEPYLAIIERGKKELGLNTENAFRLALQSILVSPEFLYIEGKPKPAAAEGEKSSAKLQPYELASRLSYFLWSSMPDDALFAAAESGKLNDPTVLRAQAQRMLADPRAQGFVEGLALSWLRLDKLGSMPPDNTKFREYYIHDFDSAMREETHRFLAHVLKQNRPVGDFLTAPYTFLNGPLARHYGIGGVEGVHFRRVALPPESHRAGLLGHGSVLTLSANGVDTSPVIRGIWILENLLGTPPAAPPPDVEPLDPDVRGTTTLRERLEAHRSNETCADCHAKIDPWGFPLEYFNAVGGYRDNYPKQRWWRGTAQGTLFVEPGKPVDGSSQLPGGDQLTQPQQLRKSLLKRSDLFHRHLAKVLLTYATGRHPSSRDLPAIDKLRETAAEEGKGFRDLVLETVLSESFLRR